MQQQPPSAIQLPDLHRALHSADCALASFAASLASAREGQQAAMQRVDSSRSLASTASPAPSTVSVSPEAISSDCFSRSSEPSPPVTHLRGMHIHSSNSSSSTIISTVTHTPDAARSPNDPMQSSSPCRVCSVSLSASDVLHASAESSSTSHLDTLARVSSMFYEIEKQNVEELRDAAAAAAMQGASQEEAIGAVGATHEKQAAPAGLLKLTISKHQWQQHMQLNMLQQHPSSSSQHEQPQQLLRSASSSSSCHSSPPSPPQSYSQPSSPVSRRSLPRSSSHSHLGSKLPPTAARFNNSSYLSAHAFEDYFRQATSLAEVVQTISREHPTYATVSIYSRARRNGLKYDSAGRACKRGVPI